MTARAVLSTIADPFTVEDGVTYERLNTSSYPSSSPPTPLPFGTGAYSEESHLRTDISEGNTGLPRGISSRLFHPSITDVITRGRLTTSAPPSSEDPWSRDISDAGSSLTYDTEEYSMHIEARSELWELVKHDEIIVLIVLVSIVTFVGLLALFVLKVILRKRHAYQLIPAHDPHHRFDYIYRPIQGNVALDDEYENTFVGVSIPILQDNTRI